MSKLLRTSSAVLTAGFVYGCAGAPPPPPPKPKVIKKVAPKKVDYLAKAKKEVAEKSFDAAIASYGKYLAEKPDDAVAHYNRGTLLLKANKLDEAVAEFQKATELAPKHTDSAVNLGVCLRSKGDLDGAVSAYRTYLKNDPFNNRVLNNLSALYREQKKFKKAISSIRTLLMRDQKNVDAYKNLALIYYDQGKYKLAMTILQNAMKMSKEQKRKDPDIHVNMGMIHLANKENGKAMAQFKFAKDMDGANILANYNIGALALSHRDYNMAAKTLAVVLKSWPNDFEVNAALGYALQGQEKFTDAAAQLEKAFGIKKDERVLNQLVVVWQSAGDAAKALSYGDQLLALQGKQCTDEDFDGFCGRYNGIKMMIAMEKENAAPPPEEEKAKPKAGQVDVFEEGGEEEVAAQEAEAAAESAAEAEGNPGVDAVKTGTTAAAGSI